MLAATKLIKTVKYEISSLKSAASAIVRKIWKG
jgi:hypothetical protein